MPERRRVRSARRKISSHAIWLTSKDSKGHSKGKPKPKLAESKSKHHSKSKYKPKSTKGDQDSEPEPPSQL